LWAARLSGAVFLASCTLGVGHFRLEKSWTRPATVQATEGRELCVELLARGVRRPQRLSLEIEVQGVSGEPVESAMPELADEQRHLRLHRRIWVERGTEGVIPVCTFLPLAALPERGGPYEAEVLLRDASGRVLGSQPMALELRRQEDETSGPGTRKAGEEPLSSGAGLPLVAPGWRNR
jgi:hypothetical protein